MRNMSFFLTPQQVIAGTKTVTRRFGWGFLKPGDMVRPVLKGMGLKRGEKIKPLRGPLRIVSLRWEPLNAIDQSDCEREGFPGMEPGEFVGMLVRHYGIKDPGVPVCRIEFSYTD